MHIIGKTFFFEGLTYNYENSHQDSSYYVYANDKEIAGPFERIYNFECLQDGKTVRFIVAEAGFSMSIYENEKKIAQADKYGKQIDDGYPKFLRKTNNVYQYISKPTSEKQNMSYGWVSSDGKNAIFLTRSENNFYVYKNEQIVAGPFNHMVEQLEQPIIRSEMARLFTPLSDDNIFCFLETMGDGTVYVYTAKEKLRIKLASYEFNPDINKLDGNLFNGKRGFLLASDMLNSPLGDSMILIMLTDGTPPYDKDGINIAFLTSKRGLVFFPYDNNIYGVYPQNHAEDNTLPSIVSINGCIYRGSICAKNVVYIKDNKIFVR